MAKAADRAGGPRMALQVGDEQNLQAWQPQPLNSSIFASEQVFYKFITDRFKFENSNMNAFKKGRQNKESRFKRPAYFKFEIYSNLLVHLPSLCNLHGAVLALARSADLNAIKLMELRL